LCIEPEPVDIDSLSIIVVLDKVFRVLFKIGRAQLSLELPLNQPLLFLLEELLETTDLRPLTLYLLLFRSLLLPDHVESVDLGSLDVHLLVQLEELLYHLLGGCVNLILLRLPLRGPLLR
jgi:hypothetical protein